MSYHQINIVAFVILILLSVAAEQRMRDRIAASAREKLSQVDKEKQLQAERKRKAAMFINMLKGGNSDSGSGVANDIGKTSSIKVWVLGSIPGLATYFRFSFRFFKKGSCQLLAKVCARRTG